MRLIVRKPLLVMAPIVAINVIKAVLMTFQEFSGAVLFAPRKNNPTGRILLVQDARVPST